MNMLNLQSLSAATLLSAIILSPNFANAGVTIIDDDVYQGSDKITTQEQFLNATSITIANFKKGTVIIDDGTQLTTQKMNIGNEESSASKGHLTLTGPNTSWTNQSSGNYVSLGSKGTGKLTLSNGAAANLNAIRAGYNTSGYAGLYVEDQNTVLNVNSIVLDNGARTFMSITNSATVNTKSFYLGANRNGYAKAYVKQDATLNVQGYINVANSYRRGYGILHIEDNATVNAAGIRLGSVGGIVIANNATLNAARTDLFQINKMAGTGTLNTNAIVLNGSIALNDNNNKIIATKIKNLNVNMDYTKKAYQIGAGLTSTGNLNISNGVQIASQFGSIGDKEYATGTVSLTGQNTNWTVDSQIIIGDEGQGTLNISGGATVQAGSVLMGYRANNKPSSSINITGQNSKLITTSHMSIGYRDNALISITDGQLHAKGLSFGRYNSNASSDLVISGQTAQLNITNGINIGTRGNSKLIASNNATINTNSISFYKPDQLRLNNATLNTNHISTQNIQDTTGQGTINKKGNVFDQTINIQSQQDLAFTQNMATNDDQNLTLNTDLSGTSNILGAGYNAQGQLNISNGMTPTSDNGMIGKNASAVGSVTVKDQNSKWQINNTLTVGNQGTGSLNISNAATVNAKKIYLGINNGSAGNITVTGQNTSLNAEGTIYISKEQQGSDIGGEGALHIQDNAVVNASHIKIDAPGEVVINNARLNLNLLFPEDLKNIQGTGTVYNRGRVYDKIVTLDSADDLYTTQLVNQYPSQNITLITDLTQEDQTLGAGRTQDGQLNILNGLQLKSKFGKFGNGTSDNNYGSYYNSNEPSSGDANHGYTNGSAKGIGNISGQNTLWEITDTLTVGGNNSILTISDGASVIAENLALSTDEYEYAEIIIQGQNASLTVNNDFHNGGKLTLKDGATLNTNTGNIYNVTIQGQGSTWNINTDVYHASNITIKDNARLNINGSAEFNSLEFGISNNNSDDFYIDITGDLDLLDSYYLEFIFEQGLILRHAQTFNLINIQGSRSGIFTSHNENDVITTINDIDLYITYAAGDGNDIALYTIPEPTALLTILTIAPLTLNRRKNKK